MLSECDRTTEFTGERKPVYSSMVHKSPVLKHEHQFFKVSQLWRIVYTILIDQSMHLK